MPFFLVLFLATAVVRAEPVGALLRPEQYVDVRDTCADIERAADGDPYAVLMVGSSPTYFLALFRAADPGRAFSMALTNFQYGSRRNAPLDEELVAKLFAYFDRALPSDEAVGGRRLLVVDFAATGHSMRALELYLRRYLRERERKLRVRFVALHLGAPPELEPGVAAVAVRGEWLKDALVSGKFAPLAPRGRYDVTLDRKPEPGQGKFPRLVKHMRRHYRQDSAIWAWSGRREQPSWLLFPPVPCARELGAPSFARAE